MKHILGSKSRSKLTNIEPKDIQPNAIDLRIDKVLLIRSKAFTISEDDKIHRGSIEMNPDENGWWTLSEGTYEVVMMNIISVGKDEAGWVITRSTLNRNGVFLTSGLYDTGYNGAMAAAMHVSCGPMRIQRGTRIGQYLSFDAESLHNYDGAYGFDENGMPKGDERKYHVVSERVSGSRWMFKDQTNERVIAENLESYLADGWTFGRWQDGANKQQQEQEEGQ